MNPDSTAWMQRASAHLATARRELAVAEEPNLEATCLHAQIAALACLRARLSAADVPFPFTSHLVVLLELCLDLQPAWERFRSHLRTLNQRAATLDDLDAPCTWEQAQEAFTCALAFHDEVRESLEASTARGAGAP